MADVLYRYGSKADFQSLTTKDSNTLYWLTDSQELYKGELLFAVGKEASTAAAGLLSAEDKAKLDALSKGAISFKGVYESLEAADAANPIPGDVILVGTKEYIYNEGAWVELGDEGIYLSRAEAEADYLKKTDAETIYETIENVDILEAQVNKVAAGVALNSRVPHFELVTDLPNCRLDDGQNDLRVYIPKGSTYTLQDSGEGSLDNLYYVGIKCWAPYANVTGCKKGDYDYYERDFATMDAIQIDAASGRPYAIFWVPVASTADNGLTWTEYSNDSRYLSWRYLIEWYVDDTMVAATSRRISLVNSFAMLYNNKDWYVKDIETQITDNKDSITEVKAAISWQPIVQV